MLEVEFAQLSDPGAIREHNEDFLGWLAPQSEAEARTRGWLFALADGVGGQARGEVASNLAVSSILDGFRKAPQGDSYTSILPRLVQEANRQIFEAAMTGGPAGISMATTVVACGLRFDGATICHVGDSRCYLVRQNYAISLTRDHTVSGEQMRMGLISAREAATAPTTELLSRALGNEMFISVETSEHQIFPGDVLLLCSDGLHHSVCAPDIAAHLSETRDLADAARGLVQLAKVRDGSDNISVQLIRIRSVERVGMYRGRHYKIQ